MPAQCDRLRPYARADEYPACRSRANGKHEKGSAMAIGDVVFFDIGETLGAVFDERGAPVPRLQAFSYVLPALERLQDNGVLLGVISNTGAAKFADVDRMLDRAGLLHHFQHSELRIYSS